MLGLFQHTAARRRLAAVASPAGQCYRVSTHSRPKAAGCSGLTWVQAGTMFQHTAARRRLAASAGSATCLRGRFNTQPPEGGWEPYGVTSAKLLTFQHTAARRRLGRPKQPLLKVFRVSTHSRPKAAGCNNLYPSSLGWAGFNTQPPEGGWHVQPLPKYRRSSFQHTAARRRLDDV